MNKAIKILLTLTLILIILPLGFAHGKVLEFDNIAAGIEVEGLPFSEVGWYPGLETEKASFTIKNNEDYDLNLFFGARLDSTEDKLAEALTVKVGNNQRQLNDLFTDSIDLGAVDNSKSFDLSVYFDNRAGSEYQDQSIEFTFLFGLEGSSPDPETGSTSQSLASISLAGDFETLEHEDVSFEHFFGQEQEEGCSTFLNEFIRFGDDNNPQEVRKLQSFLNVVMGKNLPVDGIYDLETMEAVNEFQVRYKEEILRPWVEEGIHDDEEMPTGYVFLTTRRWINMMMCPDDYLAMPDLSVYARESLQEVVDEIEFDIGEVEWMAEAAEEEAEEAEEVEVIQVNEETADPLTGLAATVGGIELEERSLLLLALIIISLIAIIFYFKKD